MHGDQAGETVRREHHGQNEDQPEIEAPGAGVIREVRVEHAEQGGADDRPEEASDAADIGHEQHHRRSLPADRGETHLLIADGVQRTRQTGEKGRQRECQPADALRVVAGELGPLRIVADGIRGLAERRQRQHEHRGDRDEAPACDQIIDLNLRPEAQPHQLRHIDPVGMDAVFAVEERQQDHGEGRRHLAETETDHGECRPGPAGRDVADQDTEDEPGQAPEQRYEDERNRMIGMGMEIVDEMDAEIAGHAEIHGMTERQHSSLAEKHVVGTGEYDEDADMVEYRQRKRRSQHPRQSDHQGCKQDPRSQPARETAHTSRFPSNPRGRTISMTTRSK